MNRSWSLFEESDFERKSKERKNEFPTLVPRLKRTMSQKPRPLLHLVFSSQNYLNNKMMLFLFYVKKRICNTYFSNFFFWHIILLSNVCDEISTKTVQCTVLVLVQCTLIQMYPISTWYKTPHRKNCFAEQANRPIKENYSITKEKHKTLEIV